MCLSAYSMYLTAQCFVSKCVALRPQVCVRVCVCVHFHAQTLSLLNSLTYERVDRDMIYVHALS